MKYNCIVMNCYGTMACVSDTVWEGTAALGEPLGASRSMYSLS